MTVDEGSVVMYGSRKIQNPNEALNDFKLLNGNEIFVDRQFFQRNSPSENVTNTTIILHVSIQGQNDVNKFLLNTTIGDATSKYN